MADTTPSYRVGLILDGTIKLQDYDLRIGSQECKIEFCGSNDNGGTDCHLIVTDKPPEELMSISQREKDCPGTAIIINGISHPFFEAQYNSLFKRAVNLKFRSIKTVTPKSIKKLVNAEVVRKIARENKFGSISLVFNRHTRGELLAQVFDLGWLLIPFILILLYGIARYATSRLGYPFSFLEWFSVYQPDWRTNTLEELKLLALIYSVFNLKFYYDYILSILANINTEIFQFSRRKRLIHKTLQFLTPILFFACALIILKAIFIFRYGFRIAEDNRFINIGSIIDSQVPIFSSKYLIYYFFSLDCGLWLLTRNFLRTSESVKVHFITARQRSTVGRAKKGFLNSVIVDLFIICSTGIAYAFFVSDPQSELAIQLIFLQAFYLIFNLMTIYYDFRES